MHCLYLDIYQYVYIYVCMYIYIYWHILSSSWRVGDSMPLLWVLSASFKFQDFRDLSSAGLGPHLEVQKLQAMRRMAALWHWTCATRIHKDPQGSTGIHMSCWQNTQQKQQELDFPDFPRFPSKESLFRIWDGKMVGKAAWAELLYVGTLLRSCHKAWKKMGELSPICSGNALLSTHIRLLRVWHGSTWFGIAFFSDSGSCAIASQTI